tara:strand:- start:1125 stop:1820 length:696 start_codon:yes stop_codon:yes gene_type:complete
MKKILLNNKLFYFFYKIKKIIFNSKKKSHLGEFGEDIFIRRFFQNQHNGFYVDVGCYHPIKGSLTYALYKKNWKGLNIDLSSVSVDLFKFSRSRDFNVQAAITDFDGKTFYYENSPINQQNSLNKNNGIKKEINAYKLNTLLEKLNIDRIDYLNIDVEGNDYKVISRFNFIKYKPQLISIEFNSYDIEKLLTSEIHICMKKNNYKLISKFGVTCFYVHEKDLKNINSFMSI